MIRTCLLLIVVWSGLVCFLAAQDTPELPKNFRPYRCLFNNYEPETRTWKPGTYFVLVSAEWCPPCQGLKRNLGQYNHIPIYFVDFDKDTSLAKKIMQSHPTVPCLVRYDMDASGTIKRSVYRYGTDLDRFLATSVLER